MKYYAMIEGERIGPLPLDQLVEAGLRPSTYVWCKGMDDWKPADEVADICRFYRQRIAELNHPTPPSPPPMPLSPREEETPPSLRMFGPVPDTTDYDRRPMSVLTFAILVTLFCFPPTGLIAIFYSLQTISKWKKGESADNPDVRSRFRKAAHNAARLSYMWLGITISMALILYSFLLLKL